MPKAKARRLSRKLVEAWLPQCVRVAACLAALAYVLTTVSLTHQHAGTPPGGADGDGPVEPLDPSGYLPAIFSATSAPLFRLGGATPPSAYANLPVSQYRPSGQFATDPSRVVTPAVITILTVTYNPRHYIFRVARFVQEQSLQAFRWIIVNDHTDDAVALQRLQELGRLAEKDWRVRIINNTGPRGGPNAMNFGMRYVRTPFVAILDDDDLWELTTLEKAALVMTWVPSAHAVGFDVVNHGAKEFIWTRGFYNGDENYFFENGLVQGSPMRTSVFDKCKFSTEYSGGAADWDLWMCMASKGMWGLHVPENGTWYQFNPESFRKKRWANLASANSLADTHETIKRKYSSVLGKEDAWPMVLPAPLKASHAHWTPVPFENRVAPTSTKRVLIIMASLKHSAAATEMLRYVKVLAEGGWRATVLATHHALGADDGGIRDAFMRYTHDVFVAPLVAPAHQVPRLLNYLIESRQISTVIVAQSKLGYALLPALSLYAPHVRLVDFVSDCSTSAEHVARESSKMDALLDLTIVSTARAFKCMRDHGKPADKLVLTRSVPVDFCKCGLIEPRERQAGKQKLGMKPDQLLIAVAPPESPNTAELLMEALLFVMRDKSGPTQVATQDGVRVYWPGAPMEKIPAADERAKRAWLSLSSPGIRAEAWALADVAIVVGSNYTDLNPATFGCRGATVLTDIESPPPAEPEWEWGHGAIVRTTALSSAAAITEYVRYIEDALVAKAAGPGGAAPAHAAAYHPGYKPAEEMAVQGKVACPCTEALRRAHEHPVTRAAPLAKTDDARRLERVIARALADEVAKWPQLFDMRTLQTKLQYRKSRQGYGRAVQLKCPERIYRNTEWIDALEAEKGCDGQAIDVQALQRAALKQCGAWCIANLAATFPDPRGWSLQGSCWTNVLSADHSCASHIDRVRLQLAPITDPTA